MLLCVAVEVCQKQPWDPIEYIGQWLLHYRIAENKRQLVSLQSYLLLCWVIQM